MLGYIINVRNSGSRLQVSLTRRSFRSDFAAKTNLHGRIKTAEKTIKKNYAVEIRAATGSTLDLMTSTLRVG